MYYCHLPVPDSPRATSGTPGVNAYAQPLISGTAHAQFAEGLHFSAVIVISCRLFANLAVHCIIIILCAYVADNSHSASSTELRSLQIYLYWLSIFKGIILGQLLRMYC